MKTFKQILEAIKDKADEGEYDYEGDMAKSQLRSIIANSKRIHDMLDDNTNLPEWVQSKITLAEDYISTASNYMQSEMSEEADLDEAKDSLAAYERRMGIRPSKATPSYKKEGKWSKQIKKQQKKAEETNEEVATTSTSGIAGIQPDETPPVFRKTKKNQKEISSIIKGMLKRKNPNG